MNDNRDHVTITLELESATAPAGWLDEMALRLGEEVRAEGLGRAAPARPAAAAPPGAKGDPITAGALAIGLTVTALPGLIALVQGWLLRQKDQTLRARIGEVELEIPRDASDAEIARIVGAVVAAGQAARAAGDHAANDHAANSPTA